jgi:DNA repair exonuclease SbcCD nuclease subunit
MRLLHIADVHLDRTFAGMSFAGCDSGRRRALLRKAFEWMVNVAIERGADALTIAGDLFELEHVTSDTAAFVARQLGRLSCPVVVAPGNHDPASLASPYRTQEWPANVIVALESRPTAVRVAGAVIWALGYPGREIDQDVLRGFRVPSDERTQILVVHGVDVATLGTDRPWGGLSLTPADVMAMGFDHALLGHIHAGHIGEVISWPGSPVPLDPSETTGNHGAIWVEATEDGLSMEVVPAPIAFFETVGVDLGEVADSNQLAALLRSSLKTLPGASSALVTLRLSGRRRPGLSIDAAELAAGVCDAALGARVLNESIAPVDLLELANEPNARGQAVKRLLEDGSDPALRAAALLVESFEGDIKGPV